MAKKSKISKNPSKAKDTAKTGIEGDQLSEEALDQVAGGVIGAVLPVQPGGLPQGPGPIRVGGSGIDTLMSGFKKGGGLAAENGCCAIERMP